MIFCYDVECRICINILHTAECKLSAIAFVRKGETSEGQAVFYRRMASCCTLL